MSNWICYSESLSLNLACLLANRNLIRRLVRSHPSLANIYFVVLWNFVALSIWTVTRALCFESPIDAARQNGEVDNFERGNIANDRKVESQTQNITTVYRYTMPFITGPNTSERSHDDVIKWKHFPRYWSFVQGIHRSTVNSPKKDQWRGAFMFSLICAWINIWENNQEACDLTCHCAHYYVIVMVTPQMAT